MATAATACAWCSDPIPPSAAGAFVVRAGAHELPTCSAGCLAELVALVAGVRIGDRRSR